MKRILISALLVIMSIPSFAQEEVEERITEIADPKAAPAVMKQDSILINVEEPVLIVDKRSGIRRWRERSMLKKVDTSYVGLPKYCWQFKVTNFAEFVDFHYTHNINKEFGTISFNSADYSGKTPLDYRIGLGIYYRGFGFQFRLKIREALEHSFSIGTNGNAFGFNLTYRKNTHFDGKIKFEGGLPKEITYPINPGDLAFTTFSVGINYNILNKRYNQAAAVNQTMIQKRSAGSPVITASFNACSLRNTGKNEMTSPFLKGYRVVNYFATVGAGYSHNFVMARKKLLLNICLIPNATVWSKSQIINRPENSHEEKKINIYREGWDRLQLYYNASMTLSYRINDHFDIGANASDSRLVYKKEAYDSAGAGFFTSNIFLNISF